MHYDYTHIYIFLTGWYHLSCIFLSLVYYLWTKLLIFSQILRISIHYFRHFWQVEIEKFTCNHWGKLFILWYLGGEIFSEAAREGKWGSPDRWNTEVGPAHNVQPFVPAVTQKSCWLVEPRFVRISPWLVSQVVVVYLLFCVVVPLLVDL